MLVVVVLFATVVLRATIVISVVYLLLPATRNCPRCAGDLAMIRHRLLRRILPLVEHRWCLGCGWSSLVRRAPRAGPARQSRVINRAAR